MFLTPPIRFIADTITKFPLLLKATIDSDGGFIVARTALIDKLVIHALKGIDDKVQINSAESSIAPRRYRQILILGAGFDTRAYRFHEFRQNQEGAQISVIEIDQSSVQRNKISRLKKNLGEEKFNRFTEGVEFIECNFEFPGALRNALIKSQLFDASLPTFILWEGVTYYLERDAIEETLSILSQLRSESSIKSEWKLVFDFVDEIIMSESAPLSQKITLEAIAAVNAPFKSGLPIQKYQLDQYLHSYEIEVDKVWTFLAMMTEMFPNICRANSRIPFALAECHWIQ